MPLLFVKVNCLAHKPLVSSRSQHPHTAHPTKLEHGTSMNYAPVWLCSELLGWRTVTFRLTLFYIEASERDCH